jgi:hypothetical protein
MILQKLQLIDKAEGRGIEIEAFVYAGWPAQQDSAHEALGPRQVVPPNQGIGSDVVIEPLARRSAQPDNSGLRRFCPQLAPCVACKQSHRRQGEHKQQTVNAPTGAIHK